MRIAPADPARMTVVEAYESVFGYRIRLYIERDRYTGTGNMAVRREIFAAVGPFAGIGVAEDMDWGRRATAMGYRHAYVPEMRVRTPARRDFAELARKWDRHIAHFYAENRARPAARLRWLARAALVAASPLGEAVRIARSDRLAGPGNRARALARRHPAPALPGRPDARARARPRPGPARRRLARGGLSLPGPVHAFLASLRDRA